MSVSSGIAAVLLPFLVLGSVFPARADDLCDKRVRRAEDHLRKEIRKHGEHSAQAQYCRRQLEEARESCGFNRSQFRGRSHDRNRHHPGRRQRDRDKDRDRDHDHDSLKSPKAAGVLTAQALRPQAVFCA